MKKRELIDRVSQRTGQPAAEVKKSIDALLVEMIDQLVSGEKVVLPGLGTLQRVWSPPRQGRNPRTGKLVQLHPRFHARFVPGATVQHRLKALIPVYDTDPEHVRARRTARTLVKDLRLYHQDLIDAARKTGKIDDALRELLVSVRETFRGRVPEATLKERNYLQEELNAAFKFEVPEFEN